MSMRLIISLLLLVSVGSIAFISCGEETLMLNDRATGYQFYPVEVGNFWIYKVDSTLVPGFKVAKDLSTSFVKEEIESSFINSQGDTTFVIQRSVSPTRNGQYIFTDRWTLERNNDNLTRVEENLRFLKIIFPVNVGDEWDSKRTTKPKQSLEFLKPTMHPK